MISIKREKVLLRPRDILPSYKDFEVIGTINPGVSRLENGDIVAYVRVIEKLKKNQDAENQYSPRMSGEENFEYSIDMFPMKEVATHSEIDFSFEDGTKRLKFISHFRRIVLDSSGFKIKSIDKKPSFFGLRWDGELGVEDPRITKIGDEYFMTYVALSKSGNITTNLAVSNDCISWYRRGIIFSHQNKDVVLFPERINHKYFAFNRPEGTFEFSSPHIWISQSENLEFWGNPSSIKLSRKKSWDSGRVGAGAPPIKLKDGWLMIYHGVIDQKIKVVKKNKEDDGERIRNIYCAGAALLDRNDPRRIISKTREPFLMPNKKYEKGTFEFKDVVFPTGVLPDLNGKDLLIFSGGGDIVTTVKKISLESLMKLMKKEKQ